MIRKFCDRCGKEVPYISTFWTRVNCNTEDHGELCAKCIDILRKAVREAVKCK